jgi:uncharacterized membrane protein YoaK (UPF0700 family)
MSSVDNRGLVFSLYALTVVSGLVDAVSFLGLQVFTANMTGNIVLLGFAVAGVPGLSIARSLTSLIAFLFGAAIGGRLGTAMAATNRKRWLVTATAAEAALLLAAALVSIGFDLQSATPASRLYGIIVLTAVAMGMRNATVRRLSIPDITTTVLTLTLTGVAADSFLAGGSNTRIGRRAATVLLMFLGAAIGALFIRRGLAVALVLSCVCVLAATAGYAALPASARLSER